MPKWWEGGHWWLVQQAHVELDEEGNLYDESPHGERQVSAGVIPGSGKAG